MRDRWIEASRYGTSEYCAIGPHHWYSCSATSSCDTLQVKIGKFMLDAKGPQAV